MTYSPAELLCFSLYAANHAMHRHYRALLDPLRLTYPQYLVMLVLWQADGQAVGQIGQAISLDSGTLTPLLKRMEKAGLLTRRRNALDERQTLIQLTDEGRAMQGRATHIAGCLLEAAGLDLPAMAILRDQVNVVRDRLNGAAPLPDAG